MHVKTLESYIQTLAAVEESEAPFFSFYATLAPGELLHRNGLRERVRQLQFVSGSHAWNGLGGVGRLLRYLAPDARLRAA